MGVHHSFGNAGDYSPILPFIGVENATFLHLLYAFCFWQVKNT